MIEQSIAKQYHILPSEQDELHFYDWYRLLAGLMDDTPLGRTVLIRREDDNSRLKSFTSHEHRIRNEWREYIAEQKKKEPDKVKTDISALENMFKEMFG